jgi:hypothetical protein
MDDEIRQLLADMAHTSKKLMDQVNHDMIGVNGKGGNGGIISKDTMRASDEHRRVMHRYQKLLNAEKHSQGVDSSATV